MWRRNAPSASNSPMRPKSTSPTYQPPFGERAIPDGVATIELWMKLSRVRRPASTSDAPVASMRPQPPSASGAVGSSPE